MPLDLSKLLVKPANAPTAETKPAVETPPVAIKTDSAPTKPKLAFQLGGKAITAPVPTPAVNQPAEVAVGKRYWYHAESESWTITEGAISAEEEESLAVNCDEFTQVEYEKALVTGAEPESVELTIRPAEPEITEVKDFRAVMDELDSLFVEGTGYTSLTIDLARQRIVTAMKELKANPELMQIVKDTDLRNIMAFIQHSADVARETLGKKKESKEKKETTKARRRTLDMSGFGASIANAVAAADKQMPQDLSQLAKLDLSQMKLPRK